MSQSIETRDVGYLEIVGANRRSRVQRWGRVEGSLALRIEQVRCSEEAGGRARCKRALKKKNMIQKAERGVPPGGCVDGEGEERSKNVV